MRSSGEELGYAGGVEASFSKTESCTQTRASGSDDDGIVLVVDDGVLARDEARSLLGLEVLGRENAGGRSRGRESSRGGAEALGELVRYLLAIEQPGGRGVKKGGNTAHQHPRDAPDGRARSCVGVG